MHTHSCAGCTVPIANGTAGRGSFSQITVCPSRPITFTPLFLLPKADHGPKQQQKEFSRCHAFVQHSSLAKRQRRDGTLAVWIGTCFKPHKTSSRIYEDLSFIHIYRVLWHQRPRPKNLSPASPALSRHNYTSCCLFYSSEACVILQQKRAHPEDKGVKNRSTSHCFFLHYINLTPYDLLHMR